MLNKTLGTWVFGTLLLAFFVGVFLFAPETLPAYKQRMLAISSALMAGLFGFFLAGDMELDIDSFKTPFGEGTIKATGSVGLFVLVLLWWFSPLSPIEVGGSFHTVRVAVLSPQGTPVDEAKVWSSLGGELLQGERGWSLEIPVSRIPEEGHLTIYAAQEPAFLTGHEEITLDPETRQDSIVVHLEQDRSALVFGTVVDSAGRPVPAAKVSVMGYPAESVLTDENGSFQLAAHAAPLQEVRLRVENDGFSPTDQYHLAGDEPVELRLFQGTEP